MRIKAIKTVKGCAPMQEDFKHKATAEEGREHWLINVYPSVEYQEIKGFGGAFTESAATTLYKLSKQNQEKFFKAYFDKTEGIGYNFGRVHINSCDFSLGNYTCVDEYDETLESFQIQRDKAYVIPMIKTAMKYGNIDLFASPWSPPAYMKTSGTMNRGGKLKKEYYELWSQYYVKFIEAYKENGVEISAITVQNEPKAVQLWDSCVYTAEEERDLVKNFLGEKMQKLGVKIWFWDHNKERVLDRAAVMLEDEEAARYIDGLAFHWYSGDHFEELEMFHKLYPSKNLVFSEGCHEYCNVVADTLKIGERYAHDLIGDFNNYCNAFCDWNLLLDETGGPNHVGNFCDAPIMADTKNDCLVIHDSYYYIAHFSKYVRQGAKRIGSSKFSSDLETVSFKNPDGCIVSVVLNRTDVAIPFAFRLLGQTVECVAEARSIATYIFQAE